MSRPRLVPPSQTSALPYKLKIIRLAQGRTQRDVARAAGIGQSTLSVIEGGLHPSPEMVRRLAAALGVSTRDLWSAPVERLIGGDGHAA